MRHELCLAMQYAHRGALLDRGRVCQTGTPEELLSAADEFKKSPHILQINGPVPEGDAVPVAAELPIDGHVAVEPRPRRRSGPFWTPCQTASTPAGTPWGWTSCIISHK